MAERSHCWIERWLRSPLFLSLSVSFSDYLSIYLSMYPSLSLCLSIYLSIYLCIHLSIYLSLSPSLYPFSWDHNPIAFCPRTKRRQPVLRRSTVCIFSGKLVVARFRHLSRSASTETANASSCQAQHRS